MFKESFYFRSFLKKRKPKDVASTKTGKTDIFESVWLCSVHPTVESSSTVCIPPRSQTPQCASHHGVRLHGVHHTAESSTTVCITLPSLTPQCASHRRVSTYQVSVLIRSFTNAISLWHLKILMWKLYCKSKFVWEIFFTSYVFLSNVFGFFMFVFSFNNVLQKNI